VGVLEGGREQADNDVNKRAVVAEFGAESANENNADMYGS
jgi:hypothetical protein